MKKPNPSLEYHWAHSILKNIMEFCPKINRLRQEENLQPKQELVYFICCDNLDVYDEEVQSFINTALKRKCRASDVFYQRYEDQKHFNGYPTVEHEYTSLFKETMPMKIFFTPIYEDS